MSYNVPPELPPHIAALFAQPTDTAPTPPVAKGTAKYSALAIRAVEEITVGIDPRYLRECTPPGLIGDLVQYVSQGMYEPFLKFAIPATLTAVSGMSGRHVKLSDGQGLNFFALLFAKSATGKTESVKTFRRFLSCIGHGVNGESINGIPDYVKDFTLDSRQGAHDTFEKTPSMCWTADECANLLDMVINPPKNTSASAISDLLNKLFDESNIYGTFSRSGSVRAKNDGEKDIPNLNVSAYWCTTTSNGKKIISKEFIDSGLGSRCLPILHEGAAGIEHTDLADQLTALPKGVVRERIRQIILQETDIRIDYISAIAAAHSSGNSFVTTPEILNRIVTMSMDAQATAYFETLRRRIGVFKRGIQNETSPYPDTYMMFTRIAMTAHRIAGTIAYFNMDGKIGIDALQWALGYVVRSIAEFLTGFDRNIFGASLSNADVTVIQVMKELLATGEFKEHGVVSKMELGRKASMRSPFRSEKDPRDALWRAVKELIEDGAIETGDADFGRQGKVFRPTSHRIWNDVDVKI